MECCANGFLISFICTWGYGCAPNVTMLKRDFGVSRAFQNGPLTNHVYVQNSNKQPQKVGFPYSEDNELLPSSFACYP